MSTLTKAHINNSLHRSIGSGTKYEEYYRYSACQSVVMGKGTTAYGVQKIAAMAHQHKDESTAIAKAEFTGYSLEKTVQKIHHFLYNHFHYDVNDDIQYLKAPNCMWSSRHKGTDCKSYSLNASTILLNLGIKHYLRRIKQATYYPELFTHIYVVIPKDQKSGSLKNGHYTLDATINSMLELPYIHKKDFYMEEANLQYVGLSAAACSCSKHTKPNYHNNIGLSAAFPGQSITQLSRGDYNTLLTESLNRVDDFLYAIAPYTNSEHSSNLLRGRIFDKLLMGKDPIIKITPNGIYVDNDFVNFSKTFSNLRNSYRNVGMGSTPTTGNPIGDFLISNILGSDFFSNTFGAIFANGFELSCWNSTFTPQKVAAEISRVHAPYFQGLFEGLQSARGVNDLNQKINFLAKAVYVCKNMYWFLRGNNNWRKCSRLALDQYNELFDALAPAFESIVTSLSYNYDIEEIRTETTDAKWNFQGYDHQWSEKTTVEYPVFRVREKAGSIPTNSNVPVVPGNDVPTGHTPVNHTPKPTKKSSGGLLLATAVIGTLLAKAA